MRLIPRTLEQIESPIVAAFALLANHTPARPLINMSQAAPAYAAASPVVEAIQRAAGEADGGYYAPGRGLEPLREAFAAELSRAYNGSVNAENVLITAGCNQAFTLLSSTIAAPGDRFILPVPYYFNHDMWLRLDGMEVDHLATPPDLIPTVEDAAQLIRPETRAIVLVTPGKPVGGGDASGPYRCVR